ncbi:MAG: hypothetical protein J6X99_02750 [Bacteroidales bacterium]|nr:hypothetical protein [Bacteroidales bacterium]
MNPKFLLLSEPQTPLIGTFVYGMVYQHKELIRSYQKTHGGGWYHKDDNRKIMTLYGRSGDYGEPDFRFLDRIPSELKGYTFLYSPDWGDEERELDLSEVEWI